MAKMHGHITTVPTGMNGAQFFRSTSASSIASAGLMAIPLSCGLGQPFASVLGRKIPKIAA
jgi:hypothetical protein